MLWCRLPAALLRRESSKSPEPRFTLWSLAVDPFVSVWDRRYEAGAEVTSGEKGDVPGPLGE